MHQLSCLRSALVSKDPSARIDHVYERVYREVHDMHWDARLAMIERSTGIETRTAHARQVRLTAGRDLPTQILNEDDAQNFRDTEELHIAHIAGDCRLEIRSMGIDIQDCVLREGNRSLSLRHFLPNGKRNLPLRWDRQHAYRESKGILLDRTEEVNASTLLPLLHEIGHARQKAATLFRWPETWMARMQAWEIGLQNRRRRECKGLQRVSGWEEQPLWALQRLHEDLSEKEIDAWQFATQALDFVGSQGFATGKVYDAELVTQHIVTALWQYRNMYARDLYISGGQMGLGFMRELYGWRPR